MPITPRGWIINDKRVEPSTGSSSFGYRLNWNAAELSSSDAAMTSPLTHRSRPRTQRGRRPHKHKTRIFHLSSVDPVDWQQKSSSVPDQPDALLQRVAFECFLCGTPLNRIHDHAQQDQTKMSIRAGFSGDMTSLISRFRLGVDKGGKSIARSWYPRADSATIFICLASKTAFREQS